MFKTCCCAPVANTVSGTQSVFFELIWTYIFSVLPTKIDFLNKGYETGDNVTTSLLVYSISHWSLLPCILYYHYCLYRTFGMKLWSQILSSLVISCDVLCSMIVMWPKWSDSAFLNLFPHLEHKKEQYISHRIFAEIKRKNTRESSPVPGGGEELRHISWFLLPWIRPPD